MKKYGLFIGLFLLTGWQGIDAQVSARLFRYPDVSDKHIVFTYGGDLWIVDKNGGTANKLSSPSGAEGFARFSPDGSQIAFSGNYDGNFDVYVMSADGSDVRNLTAGDRHRDIAVGWTPNGQHVLFTSDRSGIGNFLYFVDRAGKDAKLAIVL